MSHVQRDVREVDNCHGVVLGTQDVKVTPGCREFFLELYPWQKESGHVKQVAVNASIHLDLCAFVSPLPAGIEPAVRDVA